MIRRMSSHASGLSTALFIVTVALWLDSFNRYYTVLYLPDHPRSFGLWTIRGAVAADVTDLQIPDGMPLVATRLRGGIVDLLPDPSGHYRDLGFAGGKFGELWFHRIDHSTPASATTWPEKLRGVVFPMWLPALVFALLPARSLKRRYVLGRRRTRGRCLSCGYDLRASTNRCPECGTPIPAKQEFALSD